MIQLVRPSQGTEVGTIRRSKRKVGPPSRSDGGTSLHAEIGSKSGRRVGELEAADGVGCIRAGICTQAEVAKWPECESHGAGQHGLYDEPP